MTATLLRARAARYDAGAICSRTSIALAARWIGLADADRAEADRLETAHLGAGECLEDGRRNEAL